MEIRHLFTLLVVWGAIGHSRATAGEYQDRIRPYMQAHCSECHSGEKAKRELDLSQYVTNLDVVANFRLWKHVIEFIREGEMPQEESRHPSITVSNAVVAAI